jgi:hypothetical protein
MKVVQYVWEMFCGSLEILDAKAMKKRKYTDHGFHIMQSLKATMLYK